MSSQRKYVFSRTDEYKPALPHQKVRFMCDEISDYKAPKLSWPENTNRAIPSSTWRDRPPNASNILHRLIATIGDRFPAKGRSPSGFCDEARKIAVRLSFLGIMSGCEMRNSIIDALREADSIEMNHTRLRTGGD